MSYAYNLSDIPEKISPEPFTRFAKVVFDKNDIQNTPMSLGFFRFNPGQIGPSHLHEDEVEIYIVIKGEGEVVVGDEVVKMKTGTVVYVPPKIEHQTKNTGNTDLEFYGVFSPSIDMTAMKEWDDAPR